MTIETGNYISALNASYPDGSDAKSEGDNHIRFVKTKVKETFPNVSGAVTPTHTVLNYMLGVSSAVQTQLDAKAALASPTLTGTPVAPTAAPGTNTTQIATTAFVATSFAPLASPTLTGVPAAPTAAPGTNTTQLATTAFVIAESFVSSLPSQTGNSGKYVTTDGTTASWGSLSAYATTAAVAAAYAPLASPTLTGTPIAPTAAAGTNTTQIATTAFVTGAVGGYAADAIGTYAFAKASSQSATFGGTIAGSSLQSVCISGGTATVSNDGSTLTGTWRCMGRQNNSSDACTVFLRIA